MSGVISPYPPTVTVIGLKPSGDPSGVTDAARIMAAVAALPATGGVVNMAAGVWYLKCGSVVINASNVWFNAQGCYINAVGSGDTIRMYDSSNPLTRAVFGGGILGRPIIDGTNTGANSTGLNIGDLECMQVNVAIQNFTGAGSTGLLLNNAYFWTEEADVRATVSGCTNLVTFTDATNQASFGYGNFDFTVFQGTNQQPGVSITNGAAVYHGSLRMRGNFKSGAAATTAAALMINGQNSISQGSALDACRLDIQVECSSGGAISPATIAMSTSPFASAYNNYGILDFSYGSGGFAPSAVTTAQFSFSGIVHGDPNLGPVGGGWKNVNAPVLYNVNNSSGGNVPTPICDMSAFTLAANTTINLNPSQYNSGQTQGAPQRVTIVITQAAAGGFTVTWPSTATPSTTTPTVKWPGGIAPTMSPQPNAVDVYDLETLDGATWYGRVTQQSSNGGLVLQAATPVAGFALVNGTPNIIGWTAPNDGQQHRFTVFTIMDITAAETGGTVNVNFTMPNGVAAGYTILTGGAGAGQNFNQTTQTFICKAGTAVTVVQATALTAGAATMWAEIWGS